MKRMNCPKCKSPNPPNAEFCSLCQESFKKHRHSAADTYLRAMAKARERERGKEGKPAVQPDEAAEPAKPFIPWLDIAVAGKALRQAGTWIVRYRRPLGMLLAGLCLFLFIETAMDPATRFRWLGSRLTYNFAGPPVTYIAGSAHELTRWSERAGQMDTPLGDIKIEEIGTVSVQAQGAKKKSSVEIQCRNWLVNILRAKKTASRLLAPGSEDLASSFIELDKHGRILRRRQGPSIRVAKSAAFLAPALPNRRLKEKSAWTDTADWIDTLDGWTFRWTAERRWLAAGVEPCGENTCVRLVYEAWLKPQIVNQPAWMTGSKWRLARLQGTGEVLFDTARHEVLAHQLNYEGVLRATLSDLGQIPAALRVGRRAFHTAGEIIFRLKSRVSLRRN